MKKALILLICCLAVTFGCSGTSFGCWPSPKNVALSVNKGIVNETVQITITGEKFGNAATVILTRQGSAGTDADRIVADNVNVVSKTQITCSLNLKDKAVGLWDMTIVNKHKFLFFRIDKPAILPQGFIVEYPAPAVLDISPKQSLNNTKLTLNLSGVHFRSGAGVMLTNRQMDVGATNIKVTSDAALSCDFNLDGVVLGVYNVKVVNEDGKTGILANSFTVLNPSVTAPTISEINPEQGFNNGMVLITLTGANFDKNISVKLQDANQLTIQGTQIKVQSPAKLTCYLDITGKPEGKYDLIVTNPDGQFAEAKRAFTVQIYTSSTDINKSLKPVFFDFNKYNIRDDQISRLDYNLSILKTNAQYYVLIGGHADERGSTEYNLELSTKRAEAVKKYLVDQGVNPAQITIYAYGKDNPAQVGQGETYWWVNRRVDILIWEAPPAKDQGIRQWGNETEIP